MPEKNTVFAGKYCVCARRFNVTSQCHDLLFTVRRPDNSRGAAACLAPAGPPRLRQPPRKVGGLRDACRPQQTQTAVALRLHSLACLVRTALRHGATRPLCALRAPRRIRLPRTAPCPFLAGRKVSNTARAHAAALARWSLRYERYGPHRLPRLPGALRTCVAIPSVRVLLKPRTPKHGAQCREGKTRMRARGGQPAGQLGAGARANGVSGGVVLPEALPARQNLPARRAPANARGRPTWHVERPCKKVVDPPGLEPGTDRL